MTREEKQLLLKDLSARLSYQVVVSYKNSDTGEAYNQILDPMMYSLVQYIPYVGGLVIKPYLRPISSMTEEEKEEYKKLGLIVVQNYDGVIFPNMNEIDWLYAHHFDFRGLILKGLALEATKDMYKE